MNLLREKAGNEKGSVMVISLLILVVLTVIGVAATSTTELELQISGNDKTQKMAFYAAEAATSYVVASPDLYGPDNIIENEGLDFPNDEAPSEEWTLGEGQSFNGDVVYIGWRTPPRGSGTQAGRYRAHNYRMSCAGAAQPNALRRIDARFYRLGF
jgi:hypothetical protein